MLGRVQHLLTTEVELKKQRNQHFGDVAQGRVGLERAGRAVADAILKDERGGDAGGSDGKAGARRNRKSKVRKERV